MMDNRINYIREHLPNAKVHKCCGVIKVRQKLNDLMIGMNIGSEVMSVVRECVAMFKRRIHRG